VNRNREILEAIEADFALDVADPVTGKKVKIIPDWDIGLRKMKDYEFFFWGNDGYAHSFDVRELPNWARFDQPHPPYRDKEERKEFSIEWARYHSAQKDHVRKKILEAVAQRLIDLTV
jgi:hypothetical protein